MFQILFKILYMDHLIYSSQLYEAVLLISPFTCQKWYTSEQQNQEGYENQVKTLDKLSYENCIGTRQENKQ